MTLAASIAANGYMLATRSEAKQASAPKPKQSSHQLTPVAERKPIVVPPSIAALERQELEKRVAEMEAKLDELIPLSEKFETGEPNTEAEQRIRSVLDLVFGVEGNAERPYELECHGRICNLRTQRPDSEWRDAFYWETAGMFRSMEHGESIYMELEEPGYAAGIRYVIRIVTAAATSPAFSTCKRGFSGKGSVEVALRLDAPSRQVSVVASGPLADQTIGVCVRKAFEELVAATPLPRDVTAFPTEAIPVPVP